MASLRFIRQLPIRPTPEKLHRLMRNYGITRKSLARLMRCDPGTVDRYLRPEGAAGAQPIPLGRWELFLMKVQAVYHDDEPIELPL